MGQKTPNLDYVIHGWSLSNYLPIISFISISSSIGTSEEELKVHFKEKHKINTVKPFLIKRICRICDYDKSTSNDQLVKHITDEHPRSDYGDEDEGNIYFILFYTTMIHSINLII